MQRNPFWLVFLALIAVGILGYTVKNGVQLWRHLRMDKELSPQKVEWSILSLSDEEFVPIARYEYVFEGHTYFGQTQLKEGFLNEWAAQEAVKKLAKSPQMVFFDSTAPQVSTLQSRFPSKEIIYTLLLWLLGCYFVGLGYYARGVFF